MLAEKTVIRDHTTGDWVRLSEAAKFFPSSKRRGRCISTKVLHRYRNEGLIGADGQRHRLRAWKVGGAIVTTREAIREFVAALNATSGAEGECPPLPGFGLKS